MMKTLQVRSAVVAGAVAVTTLVGPAFGQDRGMDAAGLQRDGAQLYEENCAACHGAKGEGGAGPMLIGNTMVETMPSLIQQIFAGDLEHGMPSFTDILDDYQVAAIATYVRNSWGNQYGPAFEPSVRLRRPKSGA